MTTSAFSLQLSTPYLRPFTSSMATGACCLQTAQRDRVCGRVDGSNLTQDASMRRCIMTAPRPSIPRWNDFDAAMDRACS